MPEMTDQGAGLDRGNPTQGADAGKEGAGSFLTNLTDKPGSGTPPASQEGAQDRHIGEGQESQQQTLTLPGFAAGLSKELKADQAVLAYTGKFKSMDDLVKSAMAAESKIGSMVSIPDDKASPEQVAEFRKKLGIPEKEDDYQFEADERVKVDEGQTKAFKKLALELGLNKDQAAKLWKNANAYTADALAQFQGLGQKAKVNTEQSLQKEWGADYQKNVEVTKRGLSIYPRQQELLAEADKLGYGNAVEFIRVFQFLGSLIKEDSGAARGSVGGSGKVSGGIERPGL